MEATKRRAIPAAARYRHIATIGLGSLLLGIGATSVGWLPPLFNVSVNPVLEALRLSEFGVLVGRFSAVIGGAIILHTWLRVGVDVLRRQLTSIETLWWMLIVSIVPLLVVPPLFSRDLYSYIAQGRLMINHINPYTHGVGVIPGWFQLGADPMWAEAPTPYGPISLGLQGFVAGALPHSPWWSMLVLKFFAIVGLIVIGLAVIQLAQQHGISPTGAFWLSVLNPLMLLHFVAGGHNDSLMIAGMLWAFVFANRQQPLFAVLSLTFAAGIKPIALLALPFIGFALLNRTTTWKRVVLSWAAVTTSTLALLAAIGYALGVGVGWIGALTTPGSVRTLLSPATALGEIIGWISNGFNQDLGDTAITIARTLCLLVAFILLVIIVLRPERQSPVRQAGFAFAVVIVLSPVVQPWYLLWALPLVATSGLARAWHLRTVVLGTAFFVIYALSDINVVTDSSIDFTDLISIASSALVVAVVLMSSKRERQLAVGEQFASGLRPATDEEKASAASQRMHITR